MYIHRLYKKNPPVRHNFCQFSRMNKLTSEYTKLTACIFYGSDSERKNEYDEKK